MIFKKVTENNQNEFLSSDWKDDEGLLFNVDKLLKEHNLELVLGDGTDDNVFIKIQKREVQVDTQ